MADQEHLNILKQGVDVWNKWREEHPEIQPDLSEAILDGANLTEANLSRANCSGANFSQATLLRANLRSTNFVRTLFVGANLNEANLTETNLIEAHFIFATLLHATLVRADLGRANFSYAWLIDADLSSSILLGADLANAKISGAKLIYTHLSGANLSDADLSSANLEHANLSRAILVGTNLTRANLTNCTIYGISAWDIKLEGAKQDNLVITLPDQPIIAVDNLKIAQFIYLLLDNKEVRDVLNSVIERGVLLLGRFGGDGLELLQAIAAKLREMKYLPIIFDFERPDSRDFTETVMTLAGLSRFVIVDLSGPSVPNELRATIPHFKIPFIPIIEEGRKVYSLFPDLLGYPWVLSPVEFSSEDQLMELLPSRIIEPAEERLKERQALLNQLFNR